MSPLALDSSCSGGHFDGKGDQEQRLRHQATGKLNKL
jgi:hypothetical protein